MLLGVMQKENSGAWLWCSKDDFMIDAIRKVAMLLLLLLSCCKTVNCSNRVFLAVQSFPLVPSLLSMYLQMAKGNVGSLLVFDPAKIDFGSDEKVKSAAGDAVVGIVTERGEQWMPEHRTILLGLVLKAVADLDYPSLQIT